MPTFVTTVTMAGARDLFISRKNQYGIMTGWTGLDSSAPGSTSGMKRAFGVETVPSPIPPPTRVRRTYDDGPGRIYQFPGVAIPQGDVSMGIVDLDLEAVAQGSTPWIRGNWKKGLRGPIQPVFTNLQVLMHSQSDSEDSNTNGAPGFWNTLFGDVQMLPLGSAQHQAQQTADVRYSAIYNAMAAYIDGRPFSAANFTLVLGTTVVWWSTYPTLFMTKIGDGTNTIVLDYTPVDVQSTKVSQAAVSGGIVTVTDLTVSSVNLSTRTVTTVENHASGSYIECEYEALKLA